VLVALLTSLPPTADFVSVAEALLGLVPDGDGFSTLAEHLEANGAAHAAQTAQRCAAVLDFDADPSMDVWGGPFNGQAFRRDLFDQLLKQLKIVTIVETGTFRGTSTSYMARAGLPVFSCELGLRYFHYSSLRLADSLNVRIIRADSRRFIRELFDENLLPPGPVLFYLDAHWQQDLPLWEEIDQIFSRRPSAVIMVDDFRVPTDSGYTYDNYGKGKCLSVTNLHESVTARPAIFFPNHASANETGAHRGCVVLAQHDLALSILRDLPMLTELSWIDALVLDGVAELRSDLTSLAQKVDVQVDAVGREQVSERNLTEELRQVRAESEARLADMLANSARLEARAHELSNAATRAQFMQQQQELDAEIARRDAAATREVVTELQTLVLRLHEELRSTRTSMLELQQSLQGAEERATHATEQVVELQQSLQGAEGRATHATEQVVELQQSLQGAEGRATHATEQVVELQQSRLRRLGKRLGIARKATFEK
jgi:predicted O-methyltransferase YrrM/predicted  nucleic acid-binding Zn-ribbon protein